MPPPRIKDQRRQRRRAPQSQRSLWALPGAGGDPRPWASATPASSLAGSYPETTQTDFLHRSLHPSRLPREPPPLQPQPFSDIKILHFMPLLSVVFVFSSSQIQLHTQPLQSEGLCYSSSKTCLKILSPLLSYKWLHLPQPNSYSNFIIKAQIQSHCKIPPP